MNGAIEHENRPRGGPSLWLGGLLGGITSLPLIALLYLGSKVAGLPFVPFDLFDWLARVLPGSVINIGIDSMVRLISSLGLGPISATAKTLEQTAGVLLVIAGGVVVGVLMALGIRRTKWSGTTIGSALGALAFLVVAAVEFSLRTGISGDEAVALLWLAVVIVGWGTFLGAWLIAPALSAAPEGYSASRRALLIKLAGGSIGVAVLATGLGRFLELEQQASGAGQALSTLGATPPPGTNVPSGAPTVVITPTPLAVETAQATERERVPAAPGTRPDLTPNQNFYRIDIDTIPPIIEGGSWKLAVTGLFERPRDLTLSDLLAYPPITQPVTQACISNPVGGDLIGTTNYTGARLRDVVQDLGMRPQADALYIQSADGFYETVVMQDIMDPRTLLVYGMNGVTLPIEHGFPLRISIPNRYGMKQPKWMTSMQAIDHNASGYWVDRGWSPTAYPQILSMIDTVATSHVENGRVPVGGIAWAGDRGIKKVEVQVDKGPWAAATLRTPPLGPLTWVQWRYDWPLVRGNHTFTVRATDGTGALQIETPQDTFPNGATGYNSVGVTI